jgi:prophage tail gpP-like protein
VSDLLEEVTVEIDGAVFSGWTELEVQAGAEKAVRTARLSLPLPLIRGIRFGLPARVLAGGEPLVTGFIRDRDRSHSATSSSASLSIVSKTVDAVEASIDHPTGYVEKATLDKIAKEFGQSLTVKSRAKLSPVDYHQVMPGESVHATLERIARRQGVLIYDDGEGAIVLGDKPEGRHAGGIAWGVNILEASASETEAGRHDQTIVRGQSSKGHGAAALRLEGRAVDTAIPRPRPKVIILESDATSAGVKKRAEWSARRAAGRSVRGSARVPGWRDAAGKLWSPNWLVAFTDPDLEIDQEMAISAVAFRQSERDGTTATLTLVDPRAFGGEDPKGKSAASWSAPEPEASIEAEE